VKVYFTCCQCKRKLLGILSVDFSKMGQLLIIHFGFKVCKSVHHRTIQINHQPDTTIFQFIYSSTCFERFPAHHQELNDCSGSLWFYLRIVVIVVLCPWSGRSDTCLQPSRVGGSPLCDVVSSFLCHTHADGKDEAPGMARPFMFPALC
jgi:hypothetical protein